MITTAEERARAVGLPTPWRSHGPLLSITFFVLTCLAALAFFAFWKVLRMPAEILTFLACIAAAETLIRRYRFFGTGIESALWISGLIALIFSFPSQNKPEAIFAFAAAFAMAGWRLRQPYFGAAAVLLCIAYFGIRNADDMVLAGSVVVMCYALASLAREQDRPSVERLNEVLMIAAPLLPAFWRGSVGTGIFAAINVAWTFALIAAALVLKHHAPAIAGAVCAVIAFITLQKVIDVPLDWQLMSAGVFLLIASALLSRRLRDNTRGLVTTPSTITPFDEELQLAATIALAPKIEPSSTPHDGRGEGGGDFGGAGATGKF